MSGGSWDYLCYKMNDAAEELRKSRDILRAAFGNRMKLFAQAMHDIEWVDSGDMSTGDEIPAIRAALDPAVVPLAINEIAGSIDDIYKQVIRLTRQEDGDG